MELYVVATPLGNLGDISKRALEVLEKVDFIFAEDTRVTKKILHHFDISTPVKRYNEHSPENSFKEIKEAFSSNKSVALATDAGTPGISDPGGKLVKFVRENIPEAKVLVVPGPSAVISALSASGLPANEFTFLGYPPSKRKRKKFFERLAGVSVKPVVIYESPHRILKTLGGLGEVLGDSADVFVAREMTKVYEDYFKGSLKEATDYIKGEKEKGEFVIIIP